MFEKISIEDESYRQRIEGEKDFHDLYGPQTYDYKFIGVLRLLNYRIRELRELNDNFDQTSQEQRLEISVRSVIGTALKIFSDKEQVLAEIKNIEEQKEKLFHDSMEFFLGSSNAQLLLNEVAEDTKLWDELLLTLGMNTKITKLSEIRSRPGDVLKKISDHVDGGTFPLELWLRMLEANRQSILKKIDTFREEVLPKLRRDFLEVTSTQVGQDLLPFTAEEIRAAVEGLKCSLIDPTIATFEKIGGYYDMDTDVVSIASNAVSSYWHLDKIRQGSRLMAELFGAEEKNIFKAYDKKATREWDTLRYIFVHEVLHKLSGRTIVREGDTTPDGDPFYFYLCKQLGLRREGAIKKRLNWLNEAVTEFLTSALLEGKISIKPYAYKKEFELFNLLCESGREEIDAQLFVDAYFENYDPAKPEEERMLKWKKLAEHFVRAYSREFIIELDNTVRDEGVDKAIEMVKGFKKSD